MLCRLNRELAALAPTILQLKSVDVFHNSLMPDQAHPIAQSQFVAEIQTNLAVESEGYLIFREMLYRKFAPAAAAKFL